MVLPVPEAVRVVETGTDVEEMGSGVEGLSEKCSNQRKVLLTHCMRLR
jgi:hypothetical protein